MRGSRLVLAILIVAAFGLVMWTTRPAPTTAPAVNSVEKGVPIAGNPSLENPPAKPPESISEATPLPPLPTQTILTRSGVPMLPPPPIDEATIERELTHVQFMLRQFRDVLGENPIGNNAEIMAAVLGKNLKQAKFGAPEGQVLNENGELLDHWGTPYFFHAVSKTEMEVRSAGPDRRLWTGDDRTM